MKPATLAASAAVVFLLSGCSEKPVETLVGCFSMEPVGKSALQITEAGNGYALAQRDGDKWGEAQALKLGDEALAQQVFGADAEKIQASLLDEKNGIALFRVEPSTKISGGTADTGYLGSFFFGTGQIYKTANCD